MTTEPVFRSVVTYERVSSEDQRERATIKTQTEELVRHLGTLPDIRVVGRYQDDGVSGTVPFARRPGGARLLQDAAEKRFTEIWVYRLDRLGRDDIDPLVVRRQLEALGVTVNSVVEGHPNDFMYAILVAVGAQERRSFLGRSLAGMDRAAREGRYTGGIASFGLRVEGKKGQARLVLDEAPFWSDQSAADIMRRVYNWLVSGWTCVRIARELDALGVPTAASRTGPGTRVKATQPKWRAGRIRNMVVNPIYKGELKYGKRATKRTELVCGTVPALVSEELWQTAQEALARNRIMPTNTARTYLLRTVMKCGICGLTYVGTFNRGKVWYRCNGQFIERGPVEGRCPNKGLDATRVEPLIWADIERCLRAPGALLEELQRDVEGEAPEAVDEAERVTLEARVRELERQQDNAIDLNIKSILAIDKLQQQLDRIASERRVVEQRLTSLIPVSETLSERIPPDLMSELRRRLAAGLTERERQEVVRHLVRRITVFTERPDSEHTQIRLVVEYRFGQPEPDNAVASTPDGTGSSPPPA